MPAGDGDDLTIGVDADLDPLERSIQGAFTKIGPEIAVALSKGLSEGMLRDLPARLSKQMGPSIARVVYKSLDSAMRSQARKVDFGIADAFAAEERQVASTARQMVSITNQVITNFAEIAEAIQVRGAFAKENIAGLGVLQRTKRDNQQRLEEERRLTNELKAEYRERVIAAERESSLDRISEQGTQQRRLARTQAFYRTLTTVASSGGREIARTVGTWARRSLTDERSANDRRIGEARRTSSTLEGVERRGALSRLNILRREASDRAALTTRLQTRLGSGVLGTATGQGGLSSLLPVAGGVGVGGGILKTLNVASDFTSAMAELRVAAKPTADELARLDDLAVQLGNDAKLPGVSAVDAAQAFRQLAVSGVDLTTVLGGSGRAVLALSRALGTDAETAAKAVAAGVNVFKIGAKDTEKVADALAVASIRSGSSAAELSDAMQQAAFSFSNTFRAVDGGLPSMINMNAVLAAFAKNGIRGSDAGTSLKTALQFMGGKSKDAREMLGQLAKMAGVTGSVLYDADHNTRSFADTIKILRDGLNKLPNAEERASYISKIFGTDASRAAAVLKSLNDEDLVNFRDEVMKGGAAAQLAAAKNAGWKGALDALQSSIETVAISIGRKLEPAGRRAAFFMSDLVSNLSSGTGVWAVVRTGLLGVGAGLGSIVAAKGAVEVMGLLRIAAVSLTSPIGLATASIAALGGGLALLLRSSPAARSALDQIRTAVGSALKNAFDAVSEAVSVVAETFRGLITSVLPKVVDAISSVVSVAAAAVSVFSDLFREGFNGQTGGTDPITRIFRSIGEAARDAVAFVSALAENIAGAVTGSGSILSRIGGVFTGLAPLFDDLLGGIPSRIGHLITTNIIEPVSAYFAQFFEGRSFAEGFLRLVNDVGQKFGRTITGVLTDPNVLKVVSGVFAGLAGVAIAAVTGLISGVIEKLGLRLSHAIRQIPIFGDLIAGLTDFIPRFSGALTAALLAAVAIAFLKSPIKAIAEQTTGLIRAARVVGAAATGQTNKAAALVADQRTAQHDDAAKRRLTTALGGVGGRLVNAILSPQQAREVTERAAAMGTDAAKASARGVTDGMPLIGRAWRAVSQSVEREQKRAQYRRFLLDAKANAAASGLTQFVPQSVISQLPVPDSRFQQTVTAVGSAMSRMNNLVINAVKSSVGWMGRLAGSAREIPARFGRAATEAGNRLRAPLVAAFVAVTRQGSQMTTRFLDEFRARSAQLAGPISQVMGKVQSESARVLGAVSAAGSRVVAAVGAALGKAATAAQGFVDRVLPPGAANVVGARAAGIFSAIPQQLTRVLGMVQRGMGKLREMVTGPKFDSGYRVGGFVTTYLLGMDPEAVGRAMDRAGAAFRRFRDSLGAGFDRLRQVGSQISAVFRGDDGPEAAMRSVEATTTGFFSGLGLASDSLVGKVGGASGAIMGMVAALSLGGPLGAAVAGVTVLTTAIGYFVGKSQQGKQAAQEMAAKITELRKEIIEAKNAGTIDAFVTQNAAEQTLKFFTDFRDQVNSAEEEANGFKDSVKKAFSIALTGDLQKAMDVVIDQLDDAKGQVSGLVSGIAGAVVDGMSEADRKLLAKGTEGYKGIALAFELTPAGRAAAERAVADATAILRKGVESGAIDARFLFDRIFVQRTDTMYQVMRQGLSGIDQGMLKALGDSLANTAQAARDSSGEMAGLYGEANSKIADGNELLEVQLNLLSQQPSALDRISAKVSEQEDRLRRVKIAFQEALDPGKVQTFGRTMSSLAEQSADAAAALKDTGGVIPAFNDTSDAARKVRGQLEPLQDAFQEAAANIIAGEPDPQKAQEKIQALRDFIVTQATKSVGDAKVGGAVGAAIQAAIPDLTQTVQITTDVNVDTATKEAEKWLTYYRGALKDKVIPLELEPFIGTNTPLGLALNALLAEGFKRTSGNRPATGPYAGGTKPPDSFGWAYSQPAPPSSAAPSGGGFFGSLAKYAIPDAAATRGVYGRLIPDDLYAKIASLPVVAYTAEETAKKSGELVASLTMQKKWNELVFFMLARNGRYPGFARGGIVSTPTIARLAEKGSPEIIVPTDDPRRAFELLVAGGVLRPASQDGSGAVVAAIESLERRVASSPSGNRYYSLVTENAAMVANELRMAEIEERHHDMGRVL